MMLWFLFVFVFASLTSGAGNSIDCNDSLECPYLMIRKTNYWIYSGDPFYAIASVYDCCNVSYWWRYDLQACIISGPASFDSNMYQQCTTITYDHYCDNYYDYQHVQHVQYVPYELRSPNLKKTAPYVLLMVVHVLAIQRL